MWGDRITDCLYFVKPPSVSGNQQTITTKDEYLKTTIQNIFQRSRISSVTGLIDWWLSGIKYLNLFLFFYTFLYLCIVLSVFEDGWAAFLVILAFYYWILINLFLLSGLALELICSKVLRLRLDYDSYAPTVKKGLFLVAILIVVALTIFNLSWYLE